MITTEFERIRDLYKQKYNAHQRELALLKGNHRRFGTAKLLVFGLFVTLLVLTSGPRGLPNSALLVPPVLFIALAIPHERVIKRLRREQSASKLYYDAADRMEGHWHGRGAQGTQFRSASHLYSEDLDLFGAGSLFERLCAARTSAGEQRLASWLQEPATTDVIINRQQAARELAEKVDLRDNMALLGADAPAAANLTSVAAWGAETMPQIGALYPVVLRLVTAATVTAAIFGVITGNWIGCQVLVVVGQLAAATQAGACKQICKDLDAAGKDLEVLSELLKAIEQEAQNLQSPLLQELSKRITGDTVSASAAIGKLTQIIAWRDSMRSSLFSLIGLALMWPTHCALALRLWRQSHGTKIAEWIDAVAELEALASLARWAYERPDACWPEIATGDTPVLELTEAAHPLLPPGSAIPNTLLLDNETRMLVISGSNMSGKSTLLRTVGTSVVLALAGAPVTASAMKTSHFHTGASLCTGDSLNAGVSRFYAEITRLKHIVELAKSNPPALFLLDEILHGTNSHDRAIGAEAVLRTLVNINALGLVTTHDLALARLADAPGNSLHAVNCHMQDEMIDGRMVFDYRLRPGIVQHSNAIPLMRAVGLDV